MSKPRKADEVQNYSGYFVVKEFFSMSHGGVFLTFNPNHRYLGADGLGDAIMATDKAVFVEWE